MPRLWLELWETVQFPDEARFGRCQGRQIPVHYLQVGDEPPYISLFGDGTLPTKDEELFIVDYLKNRPVGE